VDRNQWPFHQAAGDANWRFAPRGPTADRWLPTADWRPPTADRWLATADCRLGLPTETDDQRLTTTDWCSIMR